jgi:site-specific recombinase XerD
MRRTRAATAVTPSGTRTWTVVDSSGVPIEPADQYFRWLRAVGKSANTVRTYARHVSLLFRWLEAYRVAWDDVTFDQLTTFMTDLAVGRLPVAKRGGGQRDDDTVRAVGDRPPYLIIPSDQVQKDALCYAHSWQWRRDGKPDDIQAWATSQARQPIDRVVARMLNPRGIDFTVLPPAVAAEIRFAVGTKLSRGDWTPNRRLLEVLEVLAVTAKQFAHESLLERSYESWDLLIRQEWPYKTNYDRYGRPYVKTFFATLLRGLSDDPWAEDIWLWKGCFDRILTVGDQRPPTEQNIRWNAVKLDWLRHASKQLAKRLLVNGERAWGTIQCWARALALLSRYLLAEGILDPADLDREVFLDFLTWVRENEPSKHKLMSVNQAASILETLRADGIAPDLGSPVYLRRGENAVKKPRNPRPYPADIIDAVDNKIIADPEVLDSVRIMLRFTRWAGPRISELVVLPVDILRRNATGGYWVEYWMTKTESWRRFPVPDDLASDILRQQEAVRAAYGPDACYLFPSNNSSTHAGVLVPWTSNGFRTHVRALFAKHGVCKSNITGEAVTGGEIHRYRHTVGTALLNNNWTQPEVQEFLGHLTGAMTSFYAEITDETLARKANEFHQRQNQDAAEARFDPKVERLRGKFSVVLPNGGCKLPKNMKCDFRPNPCVDCSFFEPVGEGVEEANRSHRIRLKTLVNEARDAGDQAIVDLNQPMLDRLDQILGEEDSSA